MSDYIEVPVMIFNLNKNRNCQIPNWKREKEIGNGIRNVSPKPDLFLLQEAYVRFKPRIDQTKNVMKILRKYDDDDCDFGKNTEFQNNSF